MKLSCSLALAWMACACAAAAPKPPVATSAPRLGADLRRLHAERVELTLADGRKLHGICVPPETRHASLVLHFLGAPIAEPYRAATASGGDAQKLLVDFGEHGVGSLVFDLTGDAAPSACLSPAQLRSEVLEIWQQALRLVDGDPERIILRGIWIGNLAALSLLEQGARPGCTAFIEPVGESQAASAWQACYGRLDQAQAAAPEALHFDLGKLPRLEAPGIWNAIVYLDPGGWALTPAERAALEAEGAAAGVIVWQERDGQHPLLERAYGPLALECELYDMHWPYVETGFCAIGPPLHVLEVPQFGHVVGPVIAPQAVAPTPASQH